MSQSILVIFRLQGLGYALQGWTSSEDEVLLKVRDTTPAICPRCHQGSRQRYEKGGWQKIYHGAGFGWRIYLLVRRERYFCPLCRRPFTKIHPLLAPWRRRTDLAERQLLTSLRGQSFKSVAEKEGISYGISRRVLQRWVDPEKLLWREQGEEIALGIDGHSFRGTRMVQTITDVRSRKPLTILPDGRKDTLCRFLGNIPQEIKGRIKEVCLDMDHLVLASVEKHLPEAEVVIDHFHVIQDANRRVDEARKIEQDAHHILIPRKLFLVGQEKLSPGQKKKVVSYCEKCPSLKEFYWMKEALRSFYRLKNKTVATRRLKDLIEMTRFCEDAAMLHWGRMLKRWSPYVLNFFDNRTTNAYTEGIHTKIKMIKRVSFGFRNVQIYVRKVLLCIFPWALLLSLPHFSS
jgi:transposase